MNLNNLIYTTSVWTIYGVIAVAFFALIIYLIISEKRRANEKAVEYNLTFLHIKVPPQNEIEISAAEQLFSNLVGLKKPFWKSVFTGQYRVSLEIVSKPTGIGFYAVVPDDIVSLVEKQINGAYPEAEIDIVDPNEIWDRGDFTAVAELKLSGAAFYPIKSFEAEKSKTDPLSLITSSMSKLKENEVVAIQIVISPAGDNWRKAGQRFVGDIRNRGSNPEKKVNIDTTFLEGIEKKSSKAGFDSAIRIVSISDDKFSADAHVRNVVSSFEQFTDVKYTHFSRKRINIKRTIDDFIYRKLDVKSIFIPFFDISVYHNASVLNVQELASVFHLPNKNVQTPNIIWLHARRSSAPTNLPTDGLYLGKSVFRSVNVPIHMSEKDRTRHFYIIGQTGTGKSEFMKSLAIQDIKNGEGLAFIDPHGSDIDDILTKIPPERIADVILFDASDTQRPVGLNILSADSEEEKYMVINAFIALLYKLYDPNRQGIMGPQLERSIRNLMLTAMYDPESTLVDVLRLLIDQKYIQQFLPKITDPLVKRFWTDEIAKTSDFHKSEKMGYFVSKFDRFVTDITMRNIVGQPHTAINFNKIMSEKKILLVDLAKGKIGEENSNFLGLILVPRILAAAFKRATKLGNEEFPNFYLYMDEFQNFATPDIATILSEARKYKLNLVVAHQFIAQLTDDIKEAVFGNVGTMCAFRVGPDDAEYLETQFQPSFTKADLINLPIGNCYTKLLVNGQPTVPFSMMVDWNMINQTKKEAGTAQTIRELSRNKYGIPVAEIEQFVNKRAGFLEEEQEAPRPSLRDRLPF